VAGSAWILRRSPTGATATSPGRPTSSRPTP